MGIGEAIASGRSVGVPGVLRVLELAHAKHGRLPWRRLFEPAIRLAEEGFAVSPRLHRLIAADPLLRRNAAARAYFYLPDGKPLPVGHRLRNPELAAVLRRVADEGPDAFYRGDIARDIVAAVAGAPEPGDLTEQDLAGYRALEREAVCGGYRALPHLRHAAAEFRRHRRAGDPRHAGALPDGAACGPDSSDAVHLFAEAGRLAYADRDHYVGDPDFVPVPTAGLIDPAYLRERAMLVQPGTQHGAARRRESRRARRVALRRGCDAWNRPAPATCRSSTPTATRSR